MDKPRSFELSRRAALVALGGGAATLAGCASGPAPLPAAPYSLTVWAWGEAIELLLINATDNPIQIASPFNGLPTGLGVRVRAEGGQVLTINPGDDDNYVFPYAAGTTSAPTFRRVAPWKGIKGTLDTADLVRRVSAMPLAAPLATSGRYNLDFRLSVQALGPDKKPVDARVRSRSLCSWRFEGGKALTECTSG